MIGKTRWVIPKATFRMQARTLAILRCAVTRPLAYSTPENRLRSSA